MMFSRLYITYLNSYAESPRMITLESFFLLIKTPTKNFKLIYIIIYHNNTPLY